MKTNEEFIISEYQSGKSIRRINRETGKDRGIISKILKSKGIKNISPGRRLGTRLKNRKPFIITTKGYKIIKMPPGYPGCNGKGYMREHRHVMQKHIGRTLKSYEVVHHINGNRLDNRLENLVLTTKKKHDSMRKRKH